MALTEQEVRDELAHRQHEANRVLDRWGSIRQYYRDWQDAQTDARRVFRNEWVMRWPDGRVEQVDPAIPNMMRITVKDRANSVAATPPMFMCRPAGPGDEAREAADKLERIVTSWAESNLLSPRQVNVWAQDAMVGGLAVCKVMPAKFSGMDYPTMQRLDPALSYPDPVFTPGPFCESFMYAYEEYRKNVEAEYDVKLDWRRDAPNEKVRVIEYYDGEMIQVVVETLATTYGTERPKAMLVSQAHRLSHCPIAIGTSMGVDGTYYGEFDSGMGVMDYWNKLMTMVMDDAIRRVYPERVTYNVENPEDFGPDAEIRLETPDGRYEYVGPGNQPFSNMQVLNLVQNGVRTSFMMPPARSGDPNESIISAAGVTANQGQYTEDVRAIQHAILGPMIEAAYELALESEEKWSPQTMRYIWATKQGSYRESYTPAKDIKGYRKVLVRFGAMTGLDPLNQGVMVLQQLGAGVIDQRTAMELSPFVEDPQRTEKRKLQESMQQALIQSILQQAATGAISPVTLAVIAQAVASDEVTLSEAIAALVPQQAPLAPAGGAAPAAPAAGSGATQPQAPGIAGAAEGPLPQNMSSASAGLSGNGRGSVQTRQFF